MTGKRVFWNLEEINKEIVATNRKGNCEVPVVKSDNGKVNFLLVSFDSQRDLPEQLQKFANANQLDKSFTLLHGDENAVRTLSVLVNVQFEKDVEGKFSHSNIISVLDKKGVLVFQKEGLNADPADIISSIKRQL